MTIMNLLLGYLVISTQEQVGHMGQLVGEERKDDRGSTASLSPASTMFWSLSS